MISFKQFLTEAADSKVNLHLTHADEDLFERGDKGAKAAVEFITSVLKEVGKGEVKMTTKWDGAPSIFAGWDPSDGKFFIGTKSVFNKTPKLYKTIADIDANESGGKAEKLRFALEEFPKIGIPKGTVLQGDLLWTQGDQKHETIDGKRWVTVHPNTIAYAWPADSATGKSVLAARIGVIWHTTYRGGKDLSSYKASFGADVSKLKKSRTCWMDDAFFKDADIAFTEKDFNYAWMNVVAAKALIGQFDRVASLMNDLPPAAVGAGIKTFINSYIRKGKYPNPAKAFTEYVDYVKDYWETKIIAAVKTDASKEQKRSALQQFLSQLNTNRSAVEASFEFVEYITEAKMVVVKTLNALNKQSSFVKTKDGFKVTAPEGFVAFDARKGEAVKFVDRLTFSRMNFSDEYLKGWMR
jgi:hypothetical protein